MGLWMEISYGPVGATSSQSGSEQLGVKQQSIPTLLSTSKANYIPEVMASLVWDESRDGWISHSTSL